MNKPRNKVARKISMSTMFVAYLFFISVSIYLFAGIVKMITKKYYPVIDISYGTVDDNFNISGLIVRDEVVYVSNVSGIVQYYYNNFDRVAKQDIIANIVGKDVKDIESNIDNINRTIIEKQQNNIVNSLFQSEIDSRSEQLLKLSELNSTKFMDGDISDLYNFKDTIDQAVNIRNKLYFDESSTQIRTLVEERVDEERRLSDSKNNLYADSPGILTYIVDGFEEAVAIDNIHNIPREQIDKKVDEPESMPIREVEAGDAIFKIIRSNGWYVVSYIPSDLMDGYEQGDDITLYIEGLSGYEPVQAQISSMNTAGENEDYVIFKISTKVINYMNMRNVRFKLSNAVYKGFKIPMNALVEKTALQVPAYYFTEEDAITIMKENSDVLVKPNIIKKTEDIYYIEQLEGIIAEGDTVRDSTSNESYKVQAATITGVYKVNMGYTDFTEIFYDESMKEHDGYIILDENLNTAISLHDRIISDSSEVTEDEFIY